ncbi:hypothetical protein [Kribbella sp. NPDC004875]|uniref:hypothetical protein n=1 Tax=Kribbella sp. NPDC004875 TaxID=3364107 RepID=UPI0036BF5557
MLVLQEEVTTDGVDQAGDSGREALDVADRDPEAESGGGREDMDPPGPRRCTGPLLDELVAVAEIGIASKCLVGELARRLVAIGPQCHLVCDLGQLRTGVRVVLVAGARDHEVEQVRTVSRVDTNSAVLDAVRDILMECGRRRLVGGQEDMIIDIALTMAARKAVAPA